MARLANLDAALEPPPGGESVGALSVHPEGLPADEVVEVVPRLLAVGLAGFAAMADLWGVDAEEQDTEHTLVLRDGHEGITVGDVRHGGDEGAGGGGVAREGQE